MKSARAVREECEDGGDGAAPHRAASGGLVRLTPHALEASAASLVRLHEPERMNLLGLLMRGLLSANLEDPGLRARALALRGSIDVRAGDMHVTLRFAAEGVHIAADGTSANARVSGDMKSLLGVVTGAGMIGPVLRGRVRIGGNPFLLLRVLPLIRARAGGARAEGDHPALPRAEARP
ncbi:MAG: SCP2 sterol-binding domain-containing protein [Myxococcales bacterium]|nr:SCP2 sterol-binding domain-containing protein [Myxococcales bacterium]